MRKILITAMATAAILTTASASNIDYKLIEKNSKEFMSNQNDLKISVGEFYDKAGFSVSYEKPLDLFVGDLTTNITSLRAEAGFNGTDYKDDRFMSLSIENRAYPFYFHDYESKNFGINALGIKTHLTATSFNHEIKKDKTIETLTQDDIYPDLFHSTFSTEKINKDKRINDVLAGIGIVYTEPYAFSVLEATYSKGIFDKVDSEIELKYHINDFSLSFKETKVENEKLNSFNLAYKIKF